MINKGLIEMHAIALEKIKKEEDKNMSINKRTNKQVIITNKIVNYNGGSPPLEGGTKYLSLEHPY